MKSAVTIQKDEQITDYVLCGNCEQRFNDNGERWVLEHCNNFAAGFRLNDLLNQAQPIEVVGDTAIYAGRAIPEIDIEKLAYFAASILWRGSAHDWRSGKDAVRSPKLGAYEEDFRKYLIGQAPFPPNSFFGVDIVGDQNFWPTVFVPYGGRREDLTWHYQFPFLGIVFLFLVGKSLDPARFRYCAYKSQENLITRGAMKIGTFMNDVGTLLTKSRVVGKLQKLQK
jgi:hypothetical protein